MLCPTCQEQLQSQTTDNQTFLHCSNCGSTFFDENSINRITQKSARNLAKDKKTSLDQPKILSCPRDTIFLLPLEEESIPAHVKLFQCPQCKGVFASPADLLNFKNAQDAKINYFKLWQIPLPALRSVVVFSFFALISLTVILTTSSLQRKNLTNSQASDIISNVSITTSNRYLFLTFKTGIPLRSKAIFTDQSSGVTLLRDVSVNFVTIHQLTTGDLDLSKKYTYQIVLIDRDGHSSTTPPQPLQLSPEK